MSIYLYVTADSLQTPLRWSLRAGEEQRLLDLVKQVRCLARDVNLPEQEVLGILEMTHIPHEFAVALTLGAGCLSGGTNQAKALLREHTSTQLSRAVQAVQECLHSLMPHGDKKTRFSWSPEEGTRCKLVLESATQAIQAWPWLLDAMRVGNHDALPPARHGLIPHNHSVHHTVNQPASQQDEEEWLGNRTTRRVGAIVEEDEQAGEVFHQEQQGDAAASQHRLTSERVPEEQHNWGIKLKAAESPMQPDVSTRRPKRRCAGIPSRYRS